MKSTAHPQTLKRSSVILLVVILALVQTVFHTAPGKDAVSRRSTPLVLPESAEVVGALGGRVWLSEIKGRYGFLAQSYRLVVLDLQAADNDPVATLDLSAVALATCLSGDSLYISFSTEGHTDTLVIIDVSNPLDPTIVDKIGIPGTGSNLNQICVENGYAYLTTGEEFNDKQRIIVVDLSSRVVSNTVEINVLDFFVSNSGVYVLQGVYPNIQTATLSIYQLVNFEEVGSIVVANGYRLCGVGDHVFVACWLLGGLKIVDVSTPQAPAIVGSYGVGTESFQQIEVGNPHAYLRDVSTNLVIMDISDVTNPQFVSSHALDSFFLDGVISDSLYFRMNFQFHIMDVADPYNPVILKPYDDPATVKGIAVGNNRLYCTTEENLWIYDLSSPEMPELAGTLGLSDANKVFAHDQILYVTDIDKSVTIYDVSGSGPPVEQSTYEAASTIIDIGFMGDYAYVLTSILNETGQDRSMLEIVNVGNPSSPVQDGSILLAGDGRDLFVPETGNPIYAVTFKDAVTKGFQIIDVSTPSAPVSWSQTDVEHDPRTVVVVDRTLFLGKNHDTEDHIILDVYDVTNPASPQFTHEFIPSTELSITDMLYFEDFFTLCLRPQGIFTYDYDFASQQFIQGPAADVPWPRIMTGYAPSSLAKPASPLQENEEVYVYPVSGGCHETEIVGGYGVFPVKIFIPFIGVGEPRLILALDSGPDVFMCPPDSGEEVMIAAGSLRAEGDSWLVNHMIFSTEGRGKQEDLLRAYLKIRGDEIEGDITADGQGFIAAIRFPIGKVINQGETVPFSLHYQFNTDMLTASCPLLDYVRSYGVSIHRNQINADPENDPPGEKLPSQRLYSPITRIACIWNQNTLKSFTTIQQAIDDTETDRGHTIMVCPGTYTENVDVTKELSICSVAGRDVTIVQAGNASDHVFHLKKDNTTIDGFTVKGATGEEKAGIYIHGSQVNTCEILQSAISKNEYGLYLDSAAGTHIKANDIVDNNADGILIKNGAKNNVIGDGTASGRNTISGNKGSGVKIEGAGTDNNQLIGNTIGTDKAGTGAMPNEECGVHIRGGAQENIIGDTAGNIISGNKKDGVMIEGEGTDGNRILANVIGLNAAATAKLPNQESGVHIQKKARSNIIGGTGFKDENQIAGNEINGVKIEDEGTEENIIIGNTIGTNMWGNEGLGNSGCGIYIFDEAKKNIIGGAQEGEGNIISGNLYGIWIIGEGTESNYILGNYIGTDPAGEKELGNRDGVLISGRAKLNIIGGKKEGEEIVLAKNIISGNDSAGVKLRGEETEYNGVLGNYIGTDKDGEVKVSNSIGVVIRGEAQNNMIGGFEEEDAVEPLAVASNIISGNTESGVKIEGDSTYWNQVIGNYIGTKEGGKEALGNKIGVYICNRANYNYIGNGEENGGNIISGNDSSGVKIDGSRTNHNEVQGNYIGTKKGGQEALPNKIGVHILNEAKRNYIGNGEKGGGNIISGNVESGVKIESENTAANYVKGNCIGTKEGGQEGLPNKIGVHIDDSCLNSIGGIRDGEGNIISGNTESGVKIEGVGSNQNNVTKNTIGTKAGGLEALPNKIGVHILGESKFNRIDNKNIISGNTESGVKIEGDSTKSNRVTENYIGTKEGGTEALPNKIGIHILGGARWNEIGGLLKVLGNIISGNTESGVKIEGAGTEYNGIGYNTIGTKEGGTEALPNKIGVHILGGARWNEIGHIIDSYKYQPNIISGNTESGVKIEGAGSNWNKVTKNYIGTKAGGQEALPNKTGIHLSNGAKLNEVCFDNIISGNTESGVKIEGAETERNNCQKNTIGTKAGGLEALPNKIGIHILGGAKSNAIGTSVFTMGDYGNIISGNTESGIKIEGLWTLNNKVMWNNIGTKKGGKEALPNGHGVTIGNKASLVRLEKNVISGNNRNGVYINEGGLKNDICDNFIGTDRSGKEDLGNKWNGICIVNPDSASNNTSICRNAIRYNDENGIETWNSNDNEIIDNTLWHNLRATREVNSRNLKYVNSIKGNKGDYTGIHLDHSSGEIIGNTIEGDAGDAIRCMNGSNPIIRKNNILDNAGFGLNNMDPSVAINAQHNWWGDSSGPGGAGSGSGEEVSGNVDYSNWRTDPVAVVVTAGTDTVFVPGGEVDSVYCYYQNWQRPDDVLNVTVVADSTDWLLEPTTFTAMLDDTVRTGTAIGLAVPAGTPLGASSRVRVTAVSQSDPSDTDADSFLVLTYDRLLTWIEVWPDTAFLRAGQSQQFSARGYDAVGSVMDVAVVWAATGGTIDSTGLYTAGARPGTYGVTASDASGQIQGQAVVEIVPETFVTDEERVLPKAFCLHQNYPNPFNSKTSIRFGLPRSCFVDIKVFDLVGKMIGTLVNDKMEAGYHSIIWNARDLPSGIYLCRLVAGDFVETRKLVLQR